MAGFFPCHKTVRTFPCYNTDMLRPFFIWLSRANWAKDSISKWSFSRRAALRFVSGETSAEAIAVVRRLNAGGIMATMDHLGENTTSAEAAQAAADEVIAMLDEINQAGVAANVSIKLSQMGLGLDVALCRAALARMLSHARATNNFIRIDMEDASLTERTLEMYTWAREQGFDNVGIVIQAYLYRSAADIQTILKNKGKIRLCKGAYQESPQVAYPKKADVDASYRRLTDELLADALQNGQAGSKDPRVPVTAALATHDETCIRHAQQGMARLGLPKTAVEFQMLYGIRRDLQEQLAAAGYPVRVYVPYGTHWYPYFMRRLAERPANLWFFMTNFFRR